jgi:hypothetical protein
MRYSRVQVMTIYRRADGWTSGRERNHQENLLGGILYYGPLRLGGMWEGGTGRSSVEVGGESSKGDNTGYHYCQSIMARLQGSYSVQSYSSANRSRGFSFPIFFLPRSSFSTFFPTYSRRGVESSWRVLISPLHGCRPTLLSTLLNQRLANLVWSRGRKLSFPSALVHSLQQPFWNKGIKCERVWNIPTGDWGYMAWSAMEWDPVFTVTSYVNCLHSIPACAKAILMAGTWAGLSRWLLSLSLERWKK